MINSRKISSQDSTPSVLYLKIAKSAIYKIIPFKFQVPKRDLISYRDIKKPWFWDSTLSDSSQILQNSSANFSYRLSDSTTSWNERTDTMHICSPAVHLWWFSSRTPVVVESATHARAIPKMLYKPGVSKYAPQACTHVQPYMYFAWMFHLVPWPNQVWNIPENNKKYESNTHAHTDTHIHHGDVVVVGVRGTPPNTLLSCTDFISVLP